MKLDSKTAVTVLISLVCVLAVVLVWRFVSSESNQKPQQLMGPGGTKAEAPTNTGRQVPTESAN